MMTRFSYEITVAHLETIKRLSFGRDNQEGQ